MRPAVVLVHCFGGSTRSWDAVVPALRGVEVVALDLPGFGDAAGARGPYSVAAYAGVVEAAMRALAGRRIVLVGHSMGGKVALATAARRPAGLSALVLLAPSPPTPEPISDKERAAGIAGWALYGAASKTLARITANPLADAHRNIAIGDMMRCGKAAWTAWFEQGSREDVSALMPRVAVPATILSGTCDTVLPTALMQREVADRLPQARVEPVPGAGHLLPFEAPAAVAAAVLDAVRNPTDRPLIDDHRPYTLPRMHQLEPAVDLVQ